MDYSEFVTMLARPLPTRDARVEHATLGLIGELGELADAWKKHLIYDQPFDCENAIEELGDLCFYAQMLVNELEGGMSWTFFCPAPDGKDWHLERSITRYLFEMADTIGSIAGEEEDIVDCTEHLGCLLIGLALSLDSTPEEVVRLNMEKLSKRYPDKCFTTEHAKLRLDKEDGE